MPFHLSIFILLRGLSVYTNDQYSSININNSLVLIIHSLFKHDFCVKPYVPREPRRDPSNRMLYVSLCHQWTWDMYPRLPGIVLTTCSVPSARRSNYIGHSDGHSMLHDSSWKWRKYRYAESFKLSFRLSQNAQILNAKFQNFQHLGVGHSPLPRPHPTPTRGNWP